MELIEIETALANLKTVMEQHFGKIETTDFADEWKELEDLVNGSPKTEYGAAIQNEKADQTAE